MPPLPADSIHARACKLKCEKILTRPAVMKLLQHASITFCKYETDPILIFEATHL